MYEQSVFFASGKGKYQHKCIIETKSAHAFCSVQGTFAFYKITACLQHAAAIAENVFYDELIVASGGLINYRVAIARVNSLDACSFLFG